MLMLIGYDPSEILGIIHLLVEARDLTNCCTHLAIMSPLIYNEGVPLTYVGIEFAIRKWRETRGEFLNPIIQPDNT